MIFDWCIIGHSFEVICPWSGLRIGKHWIEWHPASNWSLCLLLDIFTAAILLAEHRRHLQRNSRRVILMSGRKRSPRRAQKYQYCSLYSTHRRKTRSLPITRNVGPTSLSMLKRSRKALMSNGCSLNRPTYIRWLSSTIPDLLEWLYAAIRSSIVHCFWTIRQVNNSPLSGCLALPLSPNKEFRISLCALSDKA